MAIDQLYQQTIGKSFGNPPPLLVPNSGTYIGECVSFARQGLSALNGINLGAIGNAIDYASPSNQLKFQSAGMRWMPGNTNLLDGDLLVWGNDPGSFTGLDGHIAFSYHGQILNQNNDGKRYVTVNPFFAPGYLGNYRKGDEMVTITQAEYQDLLNWKVAGVDAVAWKNDLVASSLWPLIGGDGKNITPVTDDFINWKAYGVQQAEQAGTVGYKLLTTPVYEQVAKGE